MEYNNPAAIPHEMLYWTTWAQDKTQDQLVRLISTTITNLVPNLYLGKVTWLVNSGHVNIQQFEPILGIGNSYAYKF